MPTGTSAWSHTTSSGRRHTVHLFHPYDPFGLSIQRNGSQAALQFYVRFPNSIADCIRLPPDN